MNTGVGSKSTVLSKHIDQKVFLFEGFRLTPGYLSYSHGDWWTVTGADRVAFFLGTDLASICTIGGITRFVVYDVNYIGGC